MFLILLSTHAPSRQKFLHFHAVFRDNWLALPRGRSSISQRRGRQLWGGCQHINWPICTENCMKMKNVWSGGGEGRAPPRSATAYLRNSGSATEKDVLFNRLSVVVTLKVNLSTLQEHQKFQSKMTISIISDFLICR